MKIGIDISQIVYEGTGVARYTRGLVDSILTYGSHHEWLFFFSSLRRNLDHDLTNKILEKKIKLVHWKIPPTVISTIWNTFHTLSVQHIDNSLDWFITSDWTEPPGNMKKATVIHDLSYLRYPETVDTKILKTQERRLGWVQKESRIIFSDSKTTKNDLISLLHIEAGRVRVIYPGISITMPELAIINRVKQKFNLEKPFILAVGKIEPRKNLKRLIQAFQNLKNTSVDLIVAGSPGWETDQSIRRLMKQKKNSTFSNTIRFLGFVSDEELACLYKLCLFFVYPSIWEGFGYPPLEAMSLGCPVTMSNVSSHAEIAGNAALLFDPLDLSSIQSALTRMIADNSLRNELSKKGTIKSKEFTWKKYYDIFIQTLETT